jgi:hypothetical protein
MIGAAVFNTIISDAARHRSCYALPTVVHLMSFKVSIFGGAAPTHHRRPRMQNLRHFPIINPVNKSLN